MSKKETTPAVELRCPSPVPIDWVCTLKKGCTNTSGKKEVVVKFQFGFDARNEAARLLGVEPGQVELKAKE